MASSPRKKKKNKSKGSSSPSRTYNSKKKKKKNSIISTTPTAISKRLSFIKPRLHTSSNSEPVKIYSRSLSSVTSYNGTKRKKKKFKTMA